VNPCHHDYDHGCGVALALSIDELLAILTARAATTGRLLLPACDACRHVSSMRQRTEDLRHNVW